MSEVTVTIFNHNYRLAVSTGEEELLKNCAKTKGISLEKGVKVAFFETIEENDDLECFEKAYAPYRKDRRTDTLDEVEKELKNDRCPTEFGSRK